MPTSPSSRALSAPGPTPGGPRSRDGLAARPREWRNALIVIWGFAAVLLALVAYAVHQKVTTELRDAEDLVERNNVNLARALEEHTLRTLKSVDQAVLFVKFQYEKQGRAVNLAEYSREGMLITTIFNQIGVIDEHGQYILSSIAPHRTMDLSDREHFQVHRERDDVGLFVSKPVLGRATGKWSLQLTRRINKPDGSFGGVVVISVDPFYFTTLYSEMDLGARSVIALVGEDGVVRARRSGDDSTVGQQINDSRLFQTPAGARSGSYHTVSRVDGTARIYAWRKVREVPLLVTVGVAEDEALGEARRRARSDVVFGTFVGLVALLFAAAATWLVRRQVRVAAELDASRARAEEANRLKSEFLASMSHELRTPLNGIIGYAEYLKEDADTDERRDFAATIHQSGQHLLELVNSILDLARVEAGRLVLEPTDADLRATVAQVVRGHRPEALRKGLALEARVDEDVPALVLCDRTRLLQILNNLLHNAIKFTVAGDVRLSVACIHDRIVFSVRDSGPGIAPEDQAIVFEKFRQAAGFTTRPHGGAGLGLALCRQLVELMGGRIGLESTPGEGSTFWFDLPNVPPVSTGTSTGANAGTSSATAPASADAALPTA